MSTSHLEASGPNNDAGTIKSLLEYLDLSQLECLNESSSHKFESIVSGKAKNTSGNNYLLSDADEQLLLTIPFNQSVRVRSIAIQSSSIDHAPKTIKLLVNRPSLGFDDVEDADEPEVAQVLDISKQDVQQGTPINVRYVRFQAVNSLHIFVSANHGGQDETRIDSIDVFGLPVETTKSLSGLKQPEGI
ncbi:uncharacterized protein LACBIDRAFT_319047 [Laccaria bicolor S238N-H82]|uniref:Predicted protein n=1 Tax=Laccaria bicolor (strain S238N-H82 / ATCC MYA-4686) TaxID=486041 RepID=B0D7R2_LACBS|nr:uncharacterized protein LACBIDRAFT_319047 [Laccaria bicolor S238N-H82]EDR09445.1 predicted protein [Laccaria bicolor S238N-H82]|eukprot:XP_001879794.1 predicted protein [Laccaria bicolor S238N-H82]